jgi:hypothetical protein
MINQYHCLEKQHHTFCPVEDLSLVKDLMAQQQQQQVGDPGHRTRRFKHENRWSNQSKYIKMVIYP